MKLEKFDIDARELAHPEPLEKAIKVLQQLNNKSYLYMLHIKNPIPLLDLAQENGYRTLSQQNSSGEWQIIITNNTEVSLESLLDV